MGSPALGPRFVEGQIVFSWTIGKVCNKSLGSNGAYNYKYWATCVCGKTQQVSQKLLLEKSSTQCKSCSTANHYHKFDHPSGIRFGKLIIINRAGSSKDRDKLYLCSCDCGNTVVKKQTFLSQVASCGCDRSDKSSIGRYLAHGNYIYSFYKKGALKRGYDFSIDQSDFLKIIQQECHYCGQEPTYRYTNHKLNGFLKTNGLDRVDNNLGYFIDNCVACCKKCNIGKGTLSPIEFKEWIARVYRKLHE